MIVIFAMWFLADTGWDLHRPFHDGTVSFMFWEDILYIFQSGDYVFLWQQQILWSVSFDMYGLCIYMTGWDIFYYVNMSKQIYELDIHICWGFFSSVVSWFSYGTTLSFGSDFVYTLIWVWNSSMYRVDIFFSWVIILNCDSKWIGYFPDFVTGHFGIELICFDIWQAGII